MLGHDTPRMDSENHNRSAWLVAQAGAVHLMVGGTEQSLPAGESGYRDALRLAAGADRIFTYGPQVTRHVHAALAAAGLIPRPSLTDISAMLCVLWPCLRHYRWPRVLDELDIPAASPAHRLRLLTQLVADRFSRMDADLRALVTAVLGPSPDLDWLTRPDEVLTPAACQAVLTRLLASRPGPPRAGPQTSHAAGADQVRRFFGPNGPLSRVHPRFEYREGQQELAVAVARAFEQQEILVAEAGTGIGKSLAYLIPAALRALSGHRPIVIATYTRNLQDQLHAQEVPVAQEAVGKRLVTCVVKGRSNYACARLVSAAVAEAAATMLGGERLAGAFMASWLVQSSTADLEAISPEVVELIPELSRHIEAVRAHYWRCAKAMLGRCQYANLCPLRRLRIAAERSHLVITNQALLMADVAHDLLPQYSDLIIDEAHHLRDAATSALTVEVTSYTVWEVLRAVGVGGGGIPAALIDAAERLEEAGEQWATQAGAWQQWCDQFAAALDSLAHAALATLGVDQPTADASPIARRIDRDLAETRAWHELAQAAAMVEEMALGAAQRLQEAIGALQDQAREARVDIDSALGGLFAAAGALSELHQSLRQVMGLPPGTVGWLEAQPARDQWRWALRLAPVDVADALGAMIYERCRSVVMTGATITVDGRFDFFRQQCGLDAQAHRLAELTIPSPFDWQRQLLICVPTGMPEPRSSKHAEMVVDAVARLAEIAGGGVLVLFTARQRMLAAHQALSERLEPLGLSVLCQDVSGERWWLVEQMRAEANTVVLGVRSLWEGVDVPGHHLRCVVVEKLPFAVPDDPLVAARMQHAAESGLDPYADYYVPEAISALRQGVGRLIRTAQDRGVVFLLDGRIHTRPYGRRFLGALPPGRVASAPADECFKMAAKWLAGGDGFEARSG